MILGTCLIRILVLFLLPRVLLAVADPTLLKDFVGTYTVLEWNGNVRASGEVRIGPEGARMGVVAVPLKLGSFPVEPRSELAALEATELTETVTGVQQISTVGSERLQIDYDRGADFVRLHSRRCSARECKDNTYVLTKGGAPGQEVPAREFFAQWKGRYIIQKAGGAPPKPNASTLEVETDEEPDAAVVYGPFCLPDGNCDGGYQPFPYAKTRVFLRNFRGGKSYAIVTERSGKTLQFRWDVLETGLAFRNFHYKIENERVSLEHEFSKQ